MKICILPAIDMLAASATRSLVDDKLIIQTSEVIACSRRMVMLTDQVIAAGILKSVIVRV